jgi:hypothetical protein
MTQVQVLQLEVVVLPTFIWILGPLEDDPELECGS